MLPDALAVPVIFAPVVVITTASVPLGARVIFPEDPVTILSASVSTILPVMFRFPALMLPVIEINPADEILPMAAFPDTVAVTTVILLPVILDTALTVPPLTLPPVIFPDALMPDVAFMFAPLTLAELAMLPVAVTMPEVTRLPPVTFPPADTAATDTTLPPVMFPATDAVVAIRFPVLTFPVTCSTLVASLKVKFALASAFPAVL